MDARSNKGLAIGPPTNQLFKKDIRFGFINEEGGCNIGAHPGGHDPKREHDNCGVGDEIPPDTLLSAVKQHDEDPQLK